MTPEQLEMLKRLKAPIDKYMGEWKEGDVCYCTADDHFMYHDDIYPCDIRVPPLCTPDGKRCLWGMITDENKMKLLNSLVNYPSVYKNDIVDPYTALLKALCAQEGL